MADVMLSLGPIQFSIKGPVYDELERSSSYRWARVDRLKRRPGRQWIGIGDDEITLTGQVHTLFDPIGDGTRVGVKTIDVIRGYAAEGNPLTLISGTGKKYGKYVILNVTSKDSVLFDNGLPRKQNFTVQLACYGEDDMSQDGIIFIAGGFQQSRIAQNANLPQRAVA